MIRTKAKSLYDKALLDDDDEADAEGETGQSLASASFATSDSPPRGRGFTARTENNMCRKVSVHVLYIGPKAPGIL